MTGRISLLDSRVSVIAFAIFASVLMVSVAPASAASANDTLVVGSEHDTASELSSSALTNAHVARSGASGIVGHDVYRSSAVARWPFDYGTGNTAYDHVNGNDGNINGASWTNGIDGRALDFDGNGDYVSSGINPSGARTYSIWINPDQSLGTNRIMGAWGNNGNFQIVQYGDELVVNSNDGSTVYSVGSKLSTNEWTHVAAVFTGSAIQLYVNGQLESKTSADIGSTTTDFKIGATVDGDKSFNGQLDDGRVYAAPLSPGLIHRLADNPGIKLSPTASDRWALDAGKNSTAYSDVFGPTTINGDVRWTSGVSESAYAPDSQDGYIDVNAAGFSGDDPSKYSFSIWTNNSIANDAGWNYVAKIYSKDGVGSSIFAEWGIYGDGQLGFKFYNNSGSSYSIEAGNTDGWSNVIVTVDKTSNEVKIYRSGLLEESVTYSGTLPDITGIHLGGDQNTNRQWTGSLDEFRTYSHLLTSSEQSYIQSHPGAQLPESSTYTSSTHEVATAERASIQITEESNTSYELKAQYNDGSNWVTANSSTYTTAGTKNLSLPSVSSSEWRVVADVEATGPGPVWRMDSEAILFDARSPTVSNLRPDQTATTQNSTVTLEADIDDPDFATPQGDTVTVSWYLDGSKVHESTATSAKTVSYTPDDQTAGEHNWHVEVKDSYGETATSSTASYVIPSTMEIRDEQSLSLVNNSTVTVQFYTRDLVRTRSTTDGTVNFADLPADEEFVVYAQAENYYDRRIIVDSLYTQSTVYLLNNSANATEVEWQLRDLTGNFRSSDTKLMVQKAVNETGTSTYKTVAGDNFGADGSFPATLQRNERYLLTIKNGEGDVRDLGYWMATAEYAGVRELTVGQIQPPPPPEDQGYVAQVQSVSTDLSDHIVFKYRDTAKNVSKLTIDIYERGNPSNVLYSDTVYDTGTDYYANITVPSDSNVSTYLVSWNATRGDEVVGQTIPVGNGGPVVTDFPLGDPWPGTLGFLAILFLPTLGGGRYAPEGTVATVGVAGMLMATSIVEIKPTFWMLGALVATSMVGVKYWGGVR